MVFKRQVNYLPVTLFAFCLLDRYTLVEMKYICEKSAGMNFLVTNMLDSREIILNM